MQPAIKKKSQKIEFITSSHGKSMKQTDLEVSDLKRKIKLRFNEIQQSGTPNNSVRNLKSEHVREKTLAKGFRWHDRNADQICFP